MYLNSDEFCQNFLNENIMYIEKLKIQTRALDDNKFLLKKGERKMDLLFEVYGI